MKKCILVALTGALLSTASAFAYDPDTHMKMSDKAVIASTINTDPTVMSNLGLPPYAIDPTFPGSGSLASPAKISELVQNGANEEDGGLRSLHHFFNPLTGTSVLTPPNSHSPDWAIDGIGDPSSVQFSFKAAREYQWQAVANGLNSYAYRQKQFGLMFETLGHVIHHLQDMAQPQHVRDDLHCEFIPCALVGKYHPSLYESFTKEEKKLNFSGYAPVYSSTETTTFNAVRNFWTTTVNNNVGKGISEYTNRGFVSKGTNFDNPTFTQPAPGSSTPLPTDIATLCAEDVALGYAPCPTVLSGKMTMYSSTVTDSYRATGTQSNSRTSTQSIFDQDLNRVGKPPVFSLNRFNFHTAENLLIPRAVGYSAGLINYFFRGKMQISLPTEGVYSLIDGAASGFSKIKLALSNQSPTGEDMTGGQVVAVAKFHRNTCYINDISDALNLTGDISCRSKDEEIVVSVAQPGVVLGPSLTQFTFDFSAKPIPVNATDLYIQVVYRGKLGNEADAVVVATKDISEPTYFSYHNDSDYIHLGSHVYTRAQINAAPALLALVYPQSCVNKTISPPALKANCLQPFLLNQDWSAGSNGRSIYTVSGLPVRGHMRVVLLTELTPDTLMTDKIGTCQPFSDLVQPVTTQLNVTTNTFLWSKMTLWRGSYGWDHWSCVANGDGSLPGATDDRSSVIPYLMDGAAPTAGFVSF